MYQQLKSVARSVVPAGMLRSLEGPIRGVLALYYRGTKHTCPVCGGRFRTFIPIENQVGFSDALCPSCGSIQRKRLLWLFLMRELNLESSSWRVIDFSPHRSYSNRLRSIPGIDYLSTDYETSVQDRQYDITNIPEPDASFDLVICYHVLEHIPDDAKAMAELLRILKPGGRAVLQVPHQPGDTYEDWSITGPEAREKAFGQKDHVRHYGRKNFCERLTRAGFTVTDREYAQELGEAAISEHWLNEKEVIFLAKKP